MEGSSTSSAGIPGIAGNTAVRTGDAETGLKPISDADKVQKDINVQETFTSYERIWRAGSLQPRHFGCRRPARLQGLLRSMSMICMGSRPAAFCWICGRYCACICLAGPNRL